MNYLDDVASQIRSAVPPGDLPHDDTRDLFRMYALLVLTKGEAVTPEDVHDAWVAWMAGREQGHGSLLPYDALPADVAAQDLPYVQAIQLVARSRRTS